MSISFSINFFCYCCCCLGCRIQWDEWDELKSDTALYGRKLTVSSVFVSFDWRRHVRQSQNELRFAIVWVNNYLQSKNVPKAQSEARTIGIRITVFLIIKGEEREKGEREGLMKKCRSNRKMMGWWCGGWDWPFGIGYDSTWGLKGYSIAHRYLGKINLKWSWPTTKQRINRISIFSNLLVF